VRFGQTPAAVTFVVVARWAAALLPRTGVRPLMLAGCRCLLAGFGWLAQAHIHSSYAVGVLGPTLLIAIGIGLTFPTLMAAATADAPEGDAGTIGGLASTSSQVGGSVGLAAVGIALAIAVVSVLLPRTRAAARPEPARPTATLGTAARGSGARPAGGAGR
jgi:MFS family permease